MPLRRRSHRVVLWVVPVAALFLAWAPGCSGGSTPHADLGDGGGSDSPSSPTDANVSDTHSSLDGATDGGADGADADRGDALVCDTPCVHGVCISSGGCACDPSWAGTLCDSTATTLVPGTPVTGSVTRGAWAYYNFTGLATGVTVTVTETATTGLAWEYLNAGYVPNQTMNLAIDENAASASHTTTYSFVSPGTQTWYVGVYGQPAIPTASQVVAFSVDLTVIP